MFRKAALILALSVTVSAAIGCMGVGREGVPVRFAGQQNIVIWDAKHGVEHFIRNAKFQGTGSDLSFIAPTPGRPQIEAVSGEAFNHLATLGPGQTLPAGGSGGFGGAGGRGVSVVETRMVAGYEATVLKASDPYTLTNWLKQNGYGVPQFAAGWAAPYVTMGWYFTAFKVAGGSATGPVRMTFRARQAYNPYSVPAENGGRSGMSLYFVSAGGEEPKIGGSIPWTKPQWTAPLTNDIKDDLSKDLNLAASDIPDGAQVSFFRDPNFGRPGFKDLFFVEKPKPIRPGFGAGLYAAMLCLGAFAYTRTDRRN